MEPESSSVRSPSYSFYTLDSANSDHSELLLYLVTFTTATLPIDLDMPS